MSVSESRSHSRLGGTLCFLNMTLWDLLSQFFFLEEAASLVDGNQEPRFKSWIHPFLTG